MSDNSTVKPEVRVVEPPVTPSVPPTPRRATKQGEPFRREHVDRDPDLSLDAPDRWPRVFPGL